MDENLKIALYSSVMVGLRERKKQRTRRALIEAALRLFDEKGYEETTLAEIAAEAEVSTRTFFSYFASKEDVLFFDGGTRLATALEMISARRPDEPLADLLIRLIEAGFGQAEMDPDFAIVVSPLRMRLIMTVPALQARALQLLFDSQLTLARALQQAYPDELDLIEAAASVGALVGAAKLAVMASLARGDSLEQVWDSGRRAAQLAARGLAAISVVGASHRPAV